MVLTIIHWPHLWSNIPLSSSTKAVSAKYVKYHAPDFHNFAFGQLKQRYHANQRFILWYQLTRTDCEPTTLSSITLKFNTAIFAEISNKPNLRTGEGFSYLAMGWPGLLTSKEDFEQFDEKITPTKIVIQQLL